MREKRTTIKDVAALSEVSIATVSRVLSNSNYPVSPEMRAKVEDAAKQLGFAYTAAPRQIRGSDSREIALIIPNISNPFYSQTIQGISSVCYEKKYQLILCDTRWDVDRESSYLQELFARKVSGVIISSVLESPRTLSNYINGGMAVIQLDQRFESDGSFNINYDSRLGARMAVRHLIEKGHRRIAFASTPLTRWTRKEIYKGYTEQLKKAGIDFDEELVLISTTEKESDRDNYEAWCGESLAERLSDEQLNATAVLCVSDMVAFGLIAGLKRIGKSIPGDVSVVGVDDNPFSEVFSPPLTTVHCPTYETGRLSALMLIDRLENNSSKSTPLNMHLQPTLIERDSVKSLLKE